jgi:nitrate reductase NapAB chaperone NapD
MCRNEGMAFASYVSAETQLFLYGRTSMISSLVIHLSADPDTAKRVVHQISENGRIQHGMAIGNRIPIVLDANCSVQAEKDIEWLRQLPGVEHVDVAFVQFEESDDKGPRPSGRFGSTAKSKDRVNID